MGKENILLVHIHLMKHMVLSNLKMIKVNFLDFQLVFVQSQIVQLQVQTGGY